MVFLIAGIVFAMLAVTAVVAAVLLLPAVGRAREAARRTQSRGHLTQIALALHNYHDAHKSMPPGGIYTADDEPYNSWMTHLLPYIEQSALYNQIDHDHPWTLPANQNVHSKVIATYLNPAVEGHSTVPGDTMDLGAAHYAGNSQVLLNNRSIRFADVRDGTSFTIMAGEVSAGFKAWGDPSNVRDPAAGFGNTPNQFGSVYSNSHDGQRDDDGWLSQSCLSQHRPGSA